MGGEDIDAAPEANASLTRHEQELHVGTSSEMIGSVVVHKALERNR